jgi:hypothetical protein
MSIADGSGDNRPRHNDRDDTRGTGKNAGSAQNRDDRGAPRRGADRKRAPEGRVGSGWGGARRDDRPRRNDEGDRRDRGERSAPGRRYGSDNRRDDDRGRQYRPGGSQHDAGRGYRGGDHDRWGGRPGDAGDRRDDRRPGDERGERRWSRSGDDRREGRPSGYRGDGGARPQRDRSDRGSPRDGGRGSADRHDDRRRDDGPRYRADDRGYRGGQAGRGARSDDGGYRGGYRSRDGEPGRRPEHRSRGYRAADDDAPRDGGRRYGTDDWQARGYRSDRDRDGDFRPRDRTSDYRGSRDDRSRDGGSRRGFDGPARDRERGGNSRPGGYRDRDGQGRPDRRPDADRAPERRGDRYPERGDRSWSDRPRDRHAPNTYRAADRRDDTRRGPDRSDDRRRPGGRDARFPRDERPDRRSERTGDDRRSYRAREPLTNGRTPDDRRTGRAEPGFAGERRPGYRAEGRDRRDADEVRVPAPPLPDDVTAAELDAEVRRDLRGLQKDTAETVARHLVAAGSLVDDDPDEALAHARYARYRASRIAAVREAAGIVAYHAGEWTEALGELRAARRMGGGPGHLAVMADIERALGRPERALDLARGPESRELSRAEAIELAIVAAGARRDLGELDAAVVGLQLPELEPARRDPWSARLFYAYADNLAAAGREADAVQWFLHAADADDTGETGAAVRLAELTGEPLPDDEIEFGEEDAPIVGAGEPEPEDADPGDDVVDEIQAAPEDEEPEDTTVDGLDGEAGPAAVDVPSSAADPVVTGQAVVDADRMDAPGTADGPADR